jgi:L-malate glycosyltransferase
MKILMFSHRLEFGGTQVNAIDLAVGLRQHHGHDVVLFSTPGPLSKLAADKGLRVIPAPDARFHPSLARMRTLRAVVRQERPHVVHAWDWWQCLEAYYAVHLPMRLPLVVTDMMMSLTRILPKQVPTTFGTPELVMAAKAAGWQRVERLLPPVDVVLNAMGTVDPQPLREQCNIRPGDITLVTVSRLADCMKAESLLRSIDVVRTLGRQLPLRFVIVGDGAARARLQAMASATNAWLGRDAVVLTGALVDPRPAYAMADIVIGMGGSALRAMAFGKPVVVVGEQGFAVTFDAQTADQFLHRGLYGIGDGNPSNDHFAADITHLATHPEQWAALGRLSRDFVVEHFSLQAVSASLDRTLTAAVAADVAADVACAPSRFSSMVDSLRTAAIYLRERRFSTPSRDVIPATDMKQARHV